jgi:hypothetical protein
MWLVVSVVVVDAPSATRSLHLPSPTFPPILEHDSQPLNDHALIHSLAHIVDRQCRRRRRSQRLHLHTSLPVARDRGSDLDSVVTRDVEINRGLGERYRMAQRDQVRRSFRRHDASDPRDA